MPALGRRELAALLAREIEAPGRLAELGPLLFAPGREGEVGGEWLQALEKRHRAAWFVEAEPMWLGKFSWRLMRPLLLLGFAAAVAFALQRWVEPVVGLSLFLAGAAGLYVTVQLFAHLWARADEKRLAEADRSYRERLERLLAELGEG
jgi:hypothetical protein